MTESNSGARRIDRIRHHRYVEGLPGLELEELRDRRDECLAEREYLSLLRRLVQGRAEILRAELDARNAGTNSGPLVDRLSEILTGDEPSSTPRGEAVRVMIPQEELLLARRRVERLVADAGISNPAGLDDAALESAVGVLLTEEREVSKSRADVIRVLDTLQGELKRRYREDPNLVLR